MTDWIHPISLNSLQWALGWGRRRSVGRQQGRRVRQRHGRNQWSVSSRRRWFGTLVPGADWTMLNTQRCSGCHGSTHLAYSNHSDTFRQLSTKRSFKSSFRNFKRRRSPLEYSN